ncbi:hypothetical protein [Amycolatopsis sp. NPDC021455]|uniref:hypothetical protein n=1 Tax=Amycolatopsis sp. NPDC021455 TaxID=3154901 RepID=UPI0033D115DE
MTKKTGKPPRTVLGLIDKVLDDNARTLRAVLLILVATGCLAVIASALGPRTGEPWLGWAGIGGVLALAGGRRARKRFGGHRRE